MHDVHTHSTQTGDTGWESNFPAGNFVREAAQGGGSPLISFWYHCFTFISAHKTINCLHISVRICV